MHAIKNGHKNIVDLLIHFKVDIHAKDEKQAKALMYASFYGKLEIIEKLL